MSKKLKKALAILALVALAFGAVAGNVNFNEPKAEIHVENYKVRAGDTLWDVARYYRDLDDRNLYIFEYIDELRENNPWLIERHNQLQPNDLIQVQWFQNRKQ